MSKLHPRASFGIDNGNYCPENCKFSTPQENSNNRSKQSNNTSGFVGVTMYPIGTHKRPWMAYVYIDRKGKHIGYFVSSYMAAIARDAYIKKNNLQHKLNFGGVGYAKIA